MEEKNLEEHFENVMHTARLKLTDEEKKEIIGQLKDIFNHFSEIQKMDLNEVQVKKFSEGFETREDNISKSANAEEIVSQFNAKRERYMLAPKSLE